jgi:DNA-binding winged helix-turn-helix (wHTH) protein
VNHKAALHRKKVSPMAETQSRPRLIRFGAFEADVQTGELRKDGVKVKFSGQPFQVLAILLERPGDVVTREELQKRLWPDTFGQGEIQSLGLNQAAVIESMVEKTHAFLE